MLLGTLITTFTAIMTPSWISDWLVTTFVASNFKAESMEFA